MTKRIITGIAVCIIIALPLSIISSAYAIQDLAGWNITFKDSVNLDDVGLIQTYSVVFVSNNTTYRYLQIENTGAIAYGYPIVDIGNGNIHWDIARNGNTGQWYSNYKTVKFQSGSDITNQSLIDFVNINAQNADVDIDPVEDGYVQPFNYIENNESAFLSLKNLFSLDETYLRSIGAIFTLAQPLNVFLNIFGNIIVVAGLPAIFILLLKRMHVKSEAEPTEFQKSEYKDSKIGFHK